MNRSLPWLILVASCAPAAPAIENAARLSLVDGYLFVEVEINHRGPFRMLLDTGASSCMLTPETSRAAGLVRDHAVLLLGVAGSQRLVPAAFATVRVGAVEADSIEVLIDQLEGAQRLHAKVEGVLGQTFLGRFPYLIDYRRKRLLLGSEARRAASGLGSEVAVIGNLGHIVVPVALAPGEPLRHLVLDTAANRLILQCGSQCPRVDGPESFGTMVTNARVWMVRRGRLPALTIGGLTIRNVTVGLVEAPPPPQEDGLLPADIFSAVYVDGERGVVRLAHQ